MRCKDIVNALAIVSAIVLFGSQIRIAAQGATGRDSPNESPKKRTSTRTATSRSSGRTSKLTAEDYLTRGVDRRKKGDLDGAISDYSKAIEINPRYVAAYNNRGVARKAMGDLDGAIADYNKALEIDPRYAFGYNNRGNARKAKGDIDGAISDYNKAIEIDPRDVSAYSNRGTARKTKGDIDGAISDYNKAIEIDPNNASGYNNLAWLLATNSRPEVRNGSKAVELARKAAELTSWQDPTKLGTLGAAYAEVGNFVEAIRWQQRALEFPAYAREYGEGSRQRLQLYNDRRPYREP